MPYEDDYKMWLEDMFIKMNPDWLCDGMADKEFTHDWCEKYCGKDSDYITSKCLHIYYHHIARADRNSSENPNNCEDLQDWKDRMWAEAVVTEPQTDMAEDIVRSFGFKTESYRQAKAKDEPQTERSE